MTNPELAPDMPELLPCPFCGGEGDLKKIGNEHHKKQMAQIDCSTPGCFAQQKVAILTGRMTYEWAKEKVIERWNKRADLAPQAGSVIDDRFDWSAYPLLPL